MARDEKPVALISGGFGGLGTAMATLFIDNGWHVVLLDVDESSVGVARETVGSNGLALVGDVGRVESSRWAVRGALERFGRIDCVVNNAGAVAPMASHLADDSNWDLVMDSHARGAMHLSAAALPALLDAAWPSIVNISSVCGHRGFPGRLTYNAAKAAIEAMTRTLASEWGPAGVRVNAVAPGFILTSRAADLYAAGAADAAARANRTSLQRLGGPEEIAEAVYWLAGRRSSYVTGQVLAVDGGFLADGRTGADGVAPDAAELGALSTAGKGGGR